MHYNVIIIGSGLAGLNAALLSTKKGRVLLITKKHLTDSNTTYAQGGIAAAWDKTDTFHSHIQDTLITGAKHNNKKAVTFIIRHGPSAVKRLIKLGVPFSRTKKHALLLNLEGGHSHHRIINAGDHTGMTIEKTLAAKVRQNKRITIMENTLATDLLVQNGTCYGVIILRKNKFINIFGDKIILSCGGLASIFEHTTNPDTATGDGIAMAFRAGCKLQDLEFIQFHPTALAIKTTPKRPINNKKNTPSNLSTPPLFLLSETLRGAGATLIDSKGRQIMRDIHPLTDLAPRDIISRTIFMRTKKTSVYLDCRGIGPKKFKNHFPQIATKLASLSINPSKNPLPVTPAAHYTCGGIKTDIKGRTNIKNLYAIGETACTGLHGANRLASNSLLEAAVMSEVAAAQPIAKKKASTAFSTRLFAPQPSTISIRQQIGKIMWQHVGIVRTKSGLKKAVKTLNDFKKNLPPPTDAPTIITDNMLTCAILVARAALARKQSLGCHFIKSAPHPQLRSRV